MKATNEEISTQFSAGNFPFCYEYFADDIAWDFAGHDTQTGKEKVIAYCDKMMIEMTSATLKNTNIISDKDKVAIEGICNYPGPDNKSGELAYCDVYSFKNDKIVSITSYCIEKKR